MMFVIVILPIVIIALGFNAFRALRLADSEGRVFGQFQENRTTPRNQIDAKLFRLAKVNRGRTVR